MRIIKNTGYFLLFFFSFFQVVSAATLYGEGSNPDGVSLIDPAVPSVTHLGDPLSIGGGVDGAGMACDASGVPYITGFLSAGDNASLASIDVATGAGTYIGELSIPPGVANAFVTGMAFDSSAGIMYGISFSGGERVLVTVDLSTAVLTVVGSLGLGTTSVSGLAYDPVQNLLYAAGTTNIYTVDQASGAATLVGPHGVASASSIGLAYDPDTSRLYMTLSNQTDLLVVDTATGAASTFSALPGLSFFGFDALATCGGSVPAAPGAATPVPALSPALLAVLAAFMLVVVGYRRRFV